MGGYKKRLKSSIHNLEKEIKRKVNLLMILLIKMSHNNNRTIILKTKNKYWKKRKKFKKLFKRKYKKRSLNISLNLFKKRKLKKIK